MSDSSDPNFDQPSTPGPAIDLQEVRVMRLQPGDFVIIRVPEMETWAMETIRRDAERIFAPHRVLVSRVDIEVMRPEVEMTRGTGRPKPNPPSGPKPPPTGRATR